MEKRMCRRSDVDVIITIKEISDANPQLTQNHREKVNLVNISGTGIAFKTSQLLSMNSYYDTLIRLPNKEQLTTVTEVVRIDDSTIPDVTYGCRFIGLNKDDRMKIELYQIINDPE